MNRPAVSDGGGDIGLLLIFSTRYAAGRDSYASSILLRHRRGSLWVLHGIDPLTASLWMGHSDPNMTLRVYGHVLISGDDDWRDFWVGVYRDERLPENRATPVLHGEVYGA